MKMRERFKAHCNNSTTLEAEEVNNSYRIKCISADAITIELIMRKAYPHKLSIIAFYKHLKTSS